MPGEQVAGLQSTLSAAGFSHPVPSSKILFYLFLESGEGKEKERERNISVLVPLAHTLLGTWPTTLACALTGSRTSDPLVPRLALNP